MIVRDMIDSKDGAVLDGTTTVWPKCRETLKHQTEVAHQQASGNMVCKQGEFLAEKLTELGGGLVRTTTALQS